jgi:hypothetical protein
LSRVASSLESSSLPKVREVRRSVGGILRDCLAHRIRRDRPGRPHLKWKLGRERLRGTSGSPTDRRLTASSSKTGLPTRLEVLHELEVVTLQNTGLRFCLNRTSIPALVFLPLSSSSITRLDIQHGSCWRNVGASATTGTSSRDTGQ